MHPEGAIELVACILVELTRTAEDSLFVVSHDHGGVGHPRISERGARGTNVNDKRRLARSRV